MNKVRALHLGAIGPHTGKCCEPGCDRPGEWGLDWFTEDAWLSCNDHKVQNIKEIEEELEREAAVNRLRDVGPELLEAAKQVFEAFCEAHPECKASRALARAIAKADGKINE